MDLEKIYKWEQMSVSSIIGFMVKWFDFHNVEFNTNYRPDVESRMWYTIEVRDENSKYVFSVSAQTQTLLKQRLITQLDKLELRDKYKLQNGETPQPVKVDDAVSYNAGFEAIQLLRKMETFISVPTNSIGFNSQFEVEIKSILSKVPVSDAVLA